MFIPRELLRAVVFMGVDDGSSRRLAGTAFFVSVPAGGGLTGAHTYMVTASHCVWDWRSDEPRKGLFIRVNDLRAGTISEIDIPDGTNWFMHPDPVPRVDVAVLPLTGDLGYLLKELGHKWFGRESLFSDESLSESPDSGVGLSDEVVALGLFTNHSGRTINEPIMRLGNIAMLPQEPVATNDTFGPMEIYLVELRSIGGMSGSPVVVPHRIRIGEPRRPVSLLGVLLGHYPVQPADVAGAVVNSGIGMVAPARLLGEILDRDELRDRRAQQEERMRRLIAERDAASPAVGSNQDASDSADPLISGD